MSYGVGCRRGSDLMLPWLCHRPADVAPIGPLNCEPSYAMGAALKRQKKEKVYLGVPFVAQWLTNPTRIHKDVGSIPGLVQWFKDLALP